MNKRPNVRRAGSTEGPVQSLKQYWQKLKLLAVHPDQFYAKRKPITSRKYIALSALPPAIILSLGAGLVQHSVQGGILYLVAALAGLALLSVIERYIIMFFNEKRSFDETADLVFTVAPALVFGWIPTVGLPLVLVLSGFWNFRGLVRQFKMDQSAALAAAGLPVTITGVSIFVLILLVGPWIGAVQTMAGH